MAELITILPVIGIRGKVDRKSDEYARVVNGKTYYVHMRNKRGPDDFSEHEKAYRRHAATKYKLAAEINRDPERAKDYDDWKKKGYSCRYRYIVAQLIHSDPLTR